MSPHLSSSPMPLPLPLLLLFVLLGAACAVPPDGHNLHTDGRSILSRRAKPGSFKIPSLDIWAGYSSNADLYSNFSSLTERCSDIFRFFQIGLSVDGQPIMVLEATQHNTTSGDTFQELLRPAVHFISNIHGNEPLGRVLSWRYALWLCENYESGNPLTLDYLASTRVYFVPSFNPDGFSRHQRNNHHGKDLNRDFPDQFDPQNNDVEGRQPETKAIMDFSTRYPCVIGVGFHEGALVANYAWDGSDNTQTKYSKNPDDETFISISKKYAHAHHKMWASKEFPDGITNGAAWYPLYGGQQDWDYIQTGCFFLTVEANDNKWPRADILDQLFDDNFPAMSAMIEAAYSMGFYGRVLGSDDGQPVEAEITVEGIDHSIKSCKESGFYTRVITPGSYVVTVRAKSYRCISKRVNVLEGSAAELNFYLSKADDVNQDVTTTSGSDPPLAKDIGLAATNCPLVEIIVAEDTESQQHQAQTEADLSSSMATTSSSHLDDGDLNPSTIDDALGFGAHTVNLVHVALFTNGLILAVLSTVFLCFRFCWKQFRKKSGKGRSLANVV